MTPRHHVALARVPILISLCMLAFLMPPGAIEAQNTLSPILSGCEYDYPPYCIVNPDNSVTGFSVELLRATLKSMGRDVDFKTGPWSEVKEDLAQGRIQVLPLVGRTPEREAIFDFTFPYLVMHGTIVVRETTMEIRNPADLAGKQVAVLSGDNAEEYLLRANLGAKIVSLDSFETALRGLSKGKYDAVVIQKLVAMQIIQNSGLKNLKTVGPPLDDFKQSFCFATRKGNHELLALLNEGLSIVIADGTFRELYATWFSGIEAFGYTATRILMGGDSNYPPYEYLDKNGQPTGYNVDLTRAIARQLGLDIEIHLDTWDEMRRGLGTGAIDAIQGMFYSAERDRVYGFSPAHTVVNHVIAARSGSTLPESIKDLSGKSVIVMAGDVMDDIATKMGFGSDLVRVASQEDALRLLASGKHDYALVAQIPALYCIRKHELRNIRLSRTPVLASEYCYAVPNANGVLLAQLSQGLAAVQATGEYRKIVEKWLSPYKSEGVGILVIARYAAIIILILAALLLTVLLWSWSLKKRVVQKTRQLSLEIAERTKAVAEVVLLNQELERRVSDRTCQLEATNKELEAFAYAVSHDLRAPLRSMEGFSSILEDQYGNALDEKGHDYLRRIRDASSRMGQLIEDLLGLSRVTRSPLLRKEIDLTDLTREIVAQVLEGREDLIPAVNIEPGMNVFADPSLIEILMRNLVENAVKYSATSASPRVDIGSVGIAGTVGTKGADSPGGHGGLGGNGRAGGNDAPGGKNGNSSKNGAGRAFFVKDNGVGFDMAYADRLFRPFQRLHSLKDFPGTGIGLVTVQRIVTRHGGRVWPEAEPGKGACFYFTLG